CKAHNGNFVATNFFQSLKSHTELTFAAVDDQKLRIIIFRVLEPTLEHFLHRSKIVCSLKGAQLVPTIVFFFWNSIFEDNLAGDVLSSLKMRNVIALDSLRKLRQIKFRL